MILNEKGISIVESLVAVMLTGVAIIGLLTMQPLGLQSAGKADSISHATGMMQRELEAVESIIMTGNFTSLSQLHDDHSYSETVDNEIFTVTTNVTNPTTSTWLVHVRVAWPGNTRGVRSSIIVTRQSVFS